MRFDPGASESKVMAGMPAALAASIDFSHRGGVGDRDGEAVNLLGDEVLDDLRCVAGSCSIGPL